MRLGCILVALFALVLLQKSCEPDYAAENARNRAFAETQCANNWKQSGYRWRVIENQPYIHYPERKAHYCQVEVDGRWLPEDNVKAG